MRIQQQNRGKGKQTVYISPKNVNFGLKIYSMLWTKSAQILYIKKQNKWKHPGVKEASG